MQIVKFNKIGYGCLNLYLSPYSSSLLYSVALLIPNSSAAAHRLPFVCFNARIIRSLSSASLRSAKLTGEVGFGTASSRCSFVTVPSCACNTAPMIFCRSSRTLPGHELVSNAFRASELNPLTLHSNSLLAISRKNSASVPLFPPFQRNTMTGPWRKWRWWKTCSGRI